MEKMSEGKKKEKRETEAGSLVMTEVCAVFQGSPQNAPVKSPKHMHTGVSDFVVTAL